MYVAYDLETGGLEPEDADLLTGYFAVLNEDFKIIDELALKLKPDGRLPVVEAKAMAVNGIDIQKHIEDPETVTYKVGADKLMAMMKKYLKKNGRYSNLWLMGYNIRGFDNRWLNYHLINKKTLETIVHYKCLDVMDEVDVLKRHGWFPPSCGNLGSMVDFFGIPKTKAHDAKNDILMTVQVFLKVKELMESKKNGGNTQDLISLLEAE